jgi:hypothetical protein
VKKDHIASERGEKLQREGYVRETTMAEPRRRYVPSSVYSALHGAVQSPSVRHGGSATSFFSDPSIFTSADDDDGRRLPVVVLEVCSAR